MEIRIFWTALITLAAETRGKGVSTNCFSDNNIDTKHIKSFLDMCTHDSPSLPQDLQFHCFEAA
jgi:hypothetical protein